jgi:hypothetical protein
VVAVRFCSKQLVHLDVGSLWVKADLKTYLSILVKFSNNCLHMHLFIFFGSGQGRRIDPDWSPRHTRTIKV